MTTNKPQRTEDNDFTYRGFLITRNYVSPNGTWRVCGTQQGWRVIPSSKFRGDWHPSVKSAVERIDYLYNNFFNLSSEGKWVVVQAIRVQKRQKKEAVLN